MQPRSPEQLERDRQSKRRSRARQDPNLHRWECLQWYSRAIEDRRRQLSPFADLGLSITDPAPTFFFRYGRTFRVELWQTPEELEAELRKKGALIVPGNPEKPRQSKIPTIDAETAREILAGSAVDHGKQADKHDTEISIAVQMMLMHSHKHSHPEVQPTVARLRALREEQNDLVAKLQAIAEADLEQHGYAYVLDEK